MSALEHPRQLGEPFPLHLVQVSQHGGDHRRDLVGILLRVVRRDRDGAVEYLGDGSRIPVERGGLLWLGLWRGQRKAPSVVVTGFLGAAMLVTFSPPSSGAFAGPFTCGRIHTGRRS